MAKVRTQADRRQYATLLDRHGRKFWTVIEKDTMHPCSPLVPKGWTPPKLYGKTPFLPPDNKMQPAPDDPFTLVIDYDSWIAEVEREHVNYEERVGTAATMLFGSGAAKAIESKSPELYRYVGAAPMPVQPIKAAKAGNLYVLGLSPNMPKWAEQFFLAPIVVEELFPNAEDDYPNEEPETFVPLAADSEFPDVEEPADVVRLDPELEAALDFEEEHDPKATGGKKVNPRASAQPLPIEKPQPPKRAKAKAGK